VILAQLTSTASFIATVVSLWLGCYVVTRSPRSRLAWLAGLTLWLLANIFVSAFVSVDVSPAAIGWPAWPLNLPLAIWYHLSLETLPANRGRRQRRLLFLVYAQAVALDILAVATPLIMREGRSGLGVYTALFSHGPLFPLLPIGLIGVSSLALYNFRTARQAALNLAFRKQLNSLMIGTGLAVLGISYWMGAIGLGLQVPDLPIILALGLGVGTLGYGTVRYSALVDGRVLRYDVVFNGLLILAVSALYLAVLGILQRVFDFPNIVVVILVALAVATHSGFEFARRLLDRPFLRQSERTLRATLHSAIVDVGERKALDDGLRSALAAVVVGVNATWGAIALREGVDHVVRASYHWKRVGARLPAEALNARELTTVMPDGSSRPLAVVAPLIAEADPLGAILLGQPKGSPTYGENDLDLVSEAADGLAEFVRYVRRQETQAREIGQVLQAFRTRERELQEKIEALGSAAMPEAVDPKYIARVEDALRRLYDYSYLGEHALALDLLAYHHAATHLDRGKAVNAALVAAVEKLRPAGVEPRELPSREWHPYLVLRDAYVHGNSNRDIMSKLYVSEATFHRTRRSALRAVAKALYEMESPAGLPN